MSRDCCVALPHDAKGLSAVCDCGISGSYTLTIFAGSTEDCISRAVVSYVKLEDPR